MTHAGQFLFHLTFNGLLQLRLEDGSFVHRTANWALLNNYSLSTMYVSAHFMCWRNSVSVEDTEFIRSRMGRAWIYGMSTGELREICNTNFRAMTWNETDERVIGYIMLGESD